MMNQYTKGKWEVYCLGSEGYQIGLNNEGIPASEMKRQLSERLTPITKLHRSFEVQKTNANLIVTAINACIEINPENPQAVAESIKDIYEALKECLVFLDKQRDDYNNSPTMLPHKPVGRGPLAQRIIEVLSKVEGK